MQLKDFLPIKVDEGTRLKLLQEEFKMRSKQPEPWTKTKYRKYANFGRIKTKDEDTKAAGKAKAKRAPGKKASGKKRKTARAKRTAKKASRPARKKAKRK